MGTAPIWTIWKRTTSDGLSRGHAFRSSREFICQKFGVRSEVNVFVEERDARVTGEMQKELVLI